MLRPRGGKLGLEPHTRLFRFPMSRASFSPRALVSRFNPVERVVRDGGGMADVIGRIGSLEVRLARTTKDIRRCQRLRFKVFYEEMGATPDARGFVSRRDIDAYDRLCDHIMVIDRLGKVNRFGQIKPRVIGTYRLLRSDVARAANVDFYTAGNMTSRGFWRPIPVCACWSLAGPACSNPTGTSARSNCSGTACGRISCTTGST